MMKTRNITPWWNNYGFGKIKYGLNEWRKDWKPRYYFYPALLYTISYENHKKAQISASHRIWKYGNA